MPPAGGSFTAFASDAPPLQAHSLRSTEWNIIMRACSTGPAAMPRKPVDEDLSPHPLCPRLQPHSRKRYPCTIHGPTNYAALATWVRRSRGEPGGPLRSRPFDADAGPGRVEKVCDMSQNWGMTEVRRGLRARRARSGHKRPPYAGGMPASGVDIEANRGGSRAPERLSRALARHRPPGLDVTGKARGICFSKSPPAESWKRFTTILARFAGANRDVQETSGVAARTGRA